MKVFFIPNIGLAITGHKGYIGQSVIGDQQGYEADLHTLTPRHIVHLAAKVSEEPQTVEANLRLDMEVYEYCERHQIHLIYASGNNVYPLQERCEVGTTTLDFDTTSYYAKAKICGEQALDAFTFPRAILRIGDVFGIDQRHGAFFKAMQDAIITKKQLPLLGRGLKVRNYIYIEDLARYILYCVESSRTGTYNVCYSFASSAIDIVSQISANTDLSIHQIEAIVVENTRTMNSDLPEGFRYKYTFSQALDKFCTICKERQI